MSGHRCRYNIDGVAEGDLTPNSTYTPAVEMNTVETNILLFNTNIEMKLSLNITTLSCYEMNILYNHC